MVFEDFTRKDEKVPQDEYAESVVVLFNIHDIITERNAAKLRKKLSCSI